MKPLRIRYPESMKRAVEALARDEGWPLRVARKIEQRGRYAALQFMRLNPWTSDSEVMP